MSGALGKKLGPLPRWAWLALAVAVVAAYMLARTRSAQAQSADPGSGSASQLPQTSNDATSQGSPSDAATADLLAALGNDQRELAQALLSQTQLFYQGYGSYVPGSSLSPGDISPTVVAASRSGLSSSPIDTFTSPQGTTYTGYAAPGGGANYYVGASASDTGFVSVHTPATSTGRNVQVGQAVAA